MSENELISLEYLYKVQLLWRVTEKSFIEQTYHDNKNKKTPYPSYDNHGDCFSATKSAKSK